MGFEQLWSNLGLGFTVVLDPANLFYCFIGCLIGTLIGVLPGVGPVSTIAILLPLTFNLEPTGALIMLAGIFYGAQYGGSTAAILLRIPGESTSIVTVLDGYEMARQGRAGIALGIAALASFVAGCIATLFVAAIGEPLSRIALYFGPQEYFVLMLLGLMLASALAQGSVFKAFLMVVAGLLLSTVGSDPETGMVRNTMGIDSLWDGIDFAPLAIGLLGLPEILQQLAAGPEARRITSKIGRLLPGWRDLRMSTGPALRGTVIGGFLGILPGSGPIIAPFASYAAEKKLAADPSRFGRGAIEGVAGPEAANNAAAQTSFIPLLTLGIPPNAIMALMVGAMMIQGIVPGPQVMTSNPDLFWGVIVSMWIGNLMLIVINLPLIGIWVRLLQVPQRVLLPAIVAFCCIGVFSINNSAADVMITVGFGLLGYLLVNFGFEPAPLILGFVLGGPIEEKLRQSLILSHGDMLTFVERPVSGGMLAALGAVLLLAIMTRSFRKARQWLGPTGG